MKPVILYFSLLLTAANISLAQQPSPTPDKQKLIIAGTAAYTEDPKKILLLARKAIGSVNTLVYDAEYRTTGSMSTRSPTASGKINLSHLSPGNALKAKIAAKGVYFPSGSDEKSSFFTTFDGSTVTRIRPKAKTVTVKQLSPVDPRERTLGYVTSFFGGGAFQLLMLEYLLDTPFEQQIGGAVTDYEGQTVVSGVLCHVIYSEYLQAGKTRRERWFFGIKDNLPRRSEIIIADNDGRYGSFELALSNLQTNTRLSNQAFAIKVPTGYALKPFEEPIKPTLLNVGDLAPDWKLTDSNGIEHQLKDYRGKIVILDFWATWCGPCIQAMPELQRVSEQFKGRGVEVIGVNAWEESNAAEFMKRSGYTYGLLLHGERIADAYHIPSLPTLYVIGPDGTIIRSLKGLDNNLMEFIESLLVAAKN